MKTLLFVMMTWLALLVPAFGQDIAEVDLPKDEALMLSNAFHTVISADADLKEARERWVSAIQLVCTKHGVKYEVKDGQILLLSHELDISKGIFKPKTAKESK